MLGRTDRRLRLVVLLLAFVVMALAVVVRLSYWQLARGPQLRVEAMQQIERTDEDLPLRGNIVDRNGNVLATTSYRYLLSAAPDVIQRTAMVEPTLERLGAILELGDEDRATLRDQLDSDDPYVVLQRRLTDAQTQAVREATTSGGEAERLVGLALEPRAERFYPNPGGAPGTTLASHLLGFVNEQGDGQYGIEQYYDTLLAGTPTLTASLHDGGGLPLDSSARVLQEGHAGVDIALTIDASLQLSLEQELYTAWVADRSSRASAVVLDPDTGEILAWASVPGYDANDYARIAASAPATFQDPIATHVFEPGSVMKMLTAAAAFESGVVTPDTKVMDAVRLSFGPYSIYNFDGQSEGKLRFRDAIAFSRNIATAKVAARLDRSVQRSAERLYDMWSRLGIGTASGVDLANESVGLVADPSETTWQPVDLANRAFGQGVAITQIQLAVAYTAMANGGFQVTPHLLSEIDGEARPATEPQAVFQPRRARELQELLGHVTQRVPWYREGTQIAGYSVGGKTGTAQIWDAASGDWKRNTYNFSFVGFVGAERPEAIIAVRLHDTTPRDFGGGNLVLNIASYELFRRIAVQTVAALDVPPMPAAPSVRDEGARDEPGGAGSDDARREPGERRSDDADPGG